ncbi:MAG TPA: CopG family transcriptional regulator [Streptosporangiaceae bacterium]|nr:CopG family transcriptional regulator [Streptosporangiaceae bacterium]
MDTAAKTLRFPVDLAERLRVLAFKRRVSQASMVTEALRRYLDQEEARDAP